MTFPQTVHTRQSRRQNYRSHTSWCRAYVYMCCRDKFEKKCLWLKLNAFLSNKNSLAELCNKYYTHITTFRGWVTTMWVSRPLKISRLGQLSLSSFQPFGVDK